jgi:hypothetical protein
MVLSWNGKPTNDFMFDVLVVVGVMDEGSWNNVVGKTRSILWICVRILLAHPRILQIPNLERHS